MMYITVSLKETESFLFLTNDLNCYLFCRDLRCSLDSISIFSFETKKVEVVEVPTIVDYDHYAKRKVKH